MPFECYQVDGDFLDVLASPGVTLTELFIDSFELGLSSIVILKQMSSFAAKNSNKKIANMYARMGSRWEDAI